MRVFLEQFLGDVEALAAGGGGADGGDLGGLDGGRLVAEIVAHVGEHGGDFLVVEHAAEGRHRDEAVVFFPVQLEGAHQAVQGELDEALRIAADPRAAGERREGGVDALAVRPGGRWRSGRRGNRSSWPARNCCFSAAVRWAGTGGSGMLVHDGFLHAVEAGLGGVRGALAPDVERLAGGDGDDFLAAALFSQDPAMIASRRTRPWGSVAAFSSSAAWSAMRWVL